MPSFTGPHDFLGRYEGTWDGRPAELVITDRVDYNRPQFTCDIILTDGDSTFRANTVSPSGPDHLFEDLELHGVNGTSGSKHIELMALQTWNTRFLCGHDRWNGTPYGFSFVKLD